LRGNWPYRLYGYRPPRYPGSPSGRVHRAGVLSGSHRLNPPLCQKAIDLVSQSVYVRNHRLDQVSRHPSNPPIGHAFLGWVEMTAELKSRLQEKAILVGLERDGVSRWDVEDSLSELRQLAATAGAEVVDTGVQKLEKPRAPFYIGKGKAEGVARRCGEKHVTSLIFDDELSPAQGRNLEQLTSRKVLDRTQLILDIFARRARTREGRLQIELAQLQYLLPRL